MPAADEVAAAAVIEPTTLAVAKIVSFAGSEKKEPTAEPEAGGPAAAEIGPNRFSCADCFRVCPSAGLTSDAAALAVTDARFGATGAADLEALNDRVREADSFRTARFGVPSPPAPADTRTAVRGWCVGVDD